VPLDVPYRESVTVTRLLTEGDDRGGRVLGAAVHDQDTGEFVLFETDTVDLTPPGAACS